MIVYDTLPDHPSHFVECPCCRRKYDRMNFFTCVCGHRQTNVSPEASEKCKKCGRS